jgi:uncharacterized protein YbaA (DUF1428 family)
MTYFEGFIVPVPEANKDAYRKSAADAAPIFQEFGVSRHFEAWDSDVPEGKLTGRRQTGREGRLFLVRISRQGDPRRLQ